MIQLDALKHFFFTPSLPLGNVLGMCQFSKYTLSFQRDSLRAWTIPRLSGNPNPGAPGGLCRLMGADEISLQETAQITFQMQTIGLWEAKALHEYLLPPAEELRWFLGINPKWSQNNLRSTPLLLSKPDMDPLTRMDRNCFLDKTGPRAKK